MPLRNVLLIVTLLGSACAGSSSSELEASGQRNTPTTTAAPTTTTAPVVAASTTVLAPAQTTTSIPDDADEEMDSEPSVPYMPPTEPSEDTSLCELKDLWRGPYDPVRVGFPRPTDNVPPEGTTKYALVPIDFPDATGEPW